MPNTRSNWDGIRKHRRLVSNADNGVTDTYFDGNSDMEKFTLDEVVQMLYEYLGGETITSATTGVPLEVGLVTLEEVYDACMEL